MKQVGYLLGMFVSKNHPRILANYLDEEEVTVGLLLFACNDKMGLTYLFRKTCGSCYK